MDKNSLMASLTGEGTEQDLFGDVPIDDDPETTNGGGNPNSDPLGATVPPPVISSEPVAPVPAKGPSLLAQSGLLGEAGPDDSSENGGGVGLGLGGGLFDAVDEEEGEKEQQRKAAAEAEEKQRQQQQQQQQKQAEEAARLQRQREEQEARQRQLQQQQMQMQPTPYGYASQPNMLSSYPPQQHQAPPYHHHQQQQQQQQQHQNQHSQQSAMMQSANSMNYTNTNTNHQQNMLQSGMQNLSLQPPNQGFYREHPPSVVNTGPPAPSNAYGGAGNQYYYGTQQPQQQQQQQQHFQPNMTVGMHNGAPAQMGAGRMMQPPHPAQIRKITLVKPQEVPSLYTDIQVTEPMLIQQQNFLISSPPYWSYQITTQLAPPQQGTWLVRRRFRHVVALEDRLRQACPGSILPARPDKHATRALEEASTQQSAEFAVQRARELRQYLNALAGHPVAGQSQVLRLFLGLQDDIGTAWPEVSGNAFTKLGAVAAGMSMKVAETTQLTAGNAPVHEWEDDAELLALSSSENLRMGAVSQAVPKLEGTVTLLREQGDAAGAVGMEMSKITKMPANEDFKVCDVLSNGLLRHGRRNKRLALELSAAMDSFLQQYKMVRYEKMALQDRRQAIQRKGTYRRGADQRAMYLAQQQRQLQSAGHFGQLNQLERNAIQTDSMANDFVGEAEEIAARLKSEIHRVAIDRRMQWNASMKTIASAMKEACTERLAIWESTLEALKSVPGAMADNGMMNGTDGLMVPGPPQGSMAASQTGNGAMPSQQGEFSGGGSAMNQSQMDSSTLYT